MSIAKIFYSIAGSIAMIAILSMAPAQAATQIDIPGPPGTYSFGKFVKALPNGNIIVADPLYDITGPTTITDAGAVFLYQGRTGALISMLTGTHSYARVGGKVTVLTNGNYVVNGGVWSESHNALMGGSIFCSGATGCSGTMTAANSLTGNKPDDYAPGTITPLTNGNYLASSSSWDNGSIVDAGAVTFCSGTTGCAGPISASNSLIGSHTNDRTGESCIDSCTYGIVTLPNGNYIVSNRNWNDSRGAVTFGNGTTGVTGIISSENSLVGANPGEMAGQASPIKKGVTVLANNNYVVGTTGWNNGFGAATFCNGSTGCTGTVSAANSLIGRTGGDYVGADVVALANGNYVVISVNWDLSPDLYTVGAVTFCSGTTGCIDTVSPANSLIGDHPNDRIGEFGVQALTNGNYIVKSPSWGDADVDFGAVTFGNGITGINGTVSPSNSLVGNGYQDRIGERQFAVLNNGNYALASEKWSNGRGAVTFFNGNTGVTGVVSAANSLVGSTPGDSVGFSMAALANGNYVVASPSWDNGATPNVGAATFCNGTTGCTGLVSTANSLVGDHAGDLVSNAYRPIRSLTNGNYVITSKDWNGGRGAVTWGNGTTGTVGIVSSANSLVGVNPSEQVGSEGVAVLTNGNYMVNSAAWNNGLVQGVGAVTWRNGATGISGEISPLNSLIGTHTHDAIGVDGNNQAAGGGIYPLTNGGYIVKSRYWDNGSITDVGAISLGKADGTTLGTVSAENSVLGGMYSNTGRDTVFDYDYANRQLIVGNPDLNKVSFFRYEETRAIFDFDGDGKTDISIFRPPVGEWWYLRSSDGQNNAAQFGASSDKITPADFTGDGKTDIAFWRPSNGFWFVLRSEDSSFYSFPFGTSGDIPAPADYDGDGKADAAVFRPSTGIWYIFRSSGGTTIQQFGQNGDVPVVSDYDGDGKADIAIYRLAAGEWWIQRSAAGLIAFQFGNSADKPVHGDYTGDGKSDVAIFRPSTGEWFILRSENQSYYSFPFGTSGDIPAPGDYDGDGKFDASVFRPSGSTWFVQRTTAGTLIQNFGQSGDMPVPNAFVP